MIGADDAWMDSHYQRKNKKINIKTTSIYTWKKCHVEEKKNIWP